MGLSLSLRGAYQILFWNIIFHVVYNFIGFIKGQNLNKVGSKANDTAELFFEDVRLPETSILGGLNRGFYQLMTELPQVLEISYLWANSHKIVAGLYYGGTKLYVRLGLENIHD